MPRTGRLFCAKKYISIHVTERYLPFIQRAPKSVIDAFLCFQKIFLKKNTYPARILVELEVHFFEDLKSLVVDSNFLPFRLQTLGHGPECDSRFGGR